MRIGDALRLSPEQSSDLFYAALLKDAGCSANAERVYQMFGGPDEHETKRAVWLRDWRKLDQKVRYALEWVEPEGDFLARVRQFLRLAAIGPKAERELFEIRCARGEPSRAPRWARLFPRPGRVTTDDDRADPGGG